MAKPKILFFALAVCAIIILYVRGNNARYAFIAAQMKTKTVAKELQKVQIIADKYKMLNAAAETKILALEGKVLAIGRDAAKWHASSETAQTQIAALKTCPEKLTLTTSLLDDCQGYVLRLKTEYTTSMDDLDDAWRATCENKNRELADIYALDREHIGKIGELTERIAELTLRARRRLVIGPYVGYGMDGRASVGVGITLGLIRL